MEEKGKGLALGSLICGVIGFFIFGLPLGIAGIILGASSIKYTMGKIGLAIGIFNVIAVLIYLSNMA